MSGHAATRTADEPPTPGPYLREGYAAGWVAEGGEWLTIPGAALRSHNVVHASRAAAAAWASRWPTIGEQLQVRYVRRTFHPGVTLTSEAYRILPDPAGGPAGTGVTPAPPGATGAAGGQDAEGPGTRPGAGAHQDRT